MPLYEYKCNECGEVIEVLQKFSDEPLTVHESCGGRLERLLSSPALRFKGSGWYVNDYGRGKTSSSRGNGKNGSTESSTPAKTDSKPAEAPARKD
jgi:putative FmdB family regulatory protein